MGCYETVSQHVDYRTAFVCFHDSICMLMTAWINLHLAIDNPVPRWVHFTAFVTLDSLMVGLLLSLAP